MNTVENLSGQHFGLFTVKAYAGIRNGHAHWLCKCYCGITKIINAQKLKTGRTKSCGCLRANPGIRRRARAKVKPKERRIIALYGARNRTDYTQWTASELKILQEAMRNGIPHREVAKVLRRSLASIKRRAQRLHQGDNAAINPF